MRNALLCCMLLVAIPLPADVRQLVAEGVALYDAGRYEEAIAKFTAALAEDPASDLAAYELALTHHAKREAAPCIAVLEPRAKKKNPYQASMYAILGNCYDLGGDPKRAIATYRKGLKVDANETQLLYNLAVTLSAAGQYDEARKLLQKDLELDPNHLSGHYLLGRVFDVQNFRVPAIFQYLRFLAIAPNGERAKEAAARVLALLAGNVEQKSEGNINITISATTRKEEGDWAGMEMIIALMSAAKFMPPDEEEKPAAPLTEFEQAKKQLGTVLSVLADGDSRGRDYTSRHNLPFFREMVKQGRLDHFAGVALVPLDLPGTAEWLKQNGK